MHALLRAAPVWAGALLALGPVAAQPVAPAAHLTTLAVQAGPVEVASGPFRVAGRAAVAAPLVSGPVLVWATTSPASVEASADLPETAAAAPALGTAAELPAEIALRAVYPNPLATRARVPFELPEAGHVRLAVYDVLGREVAVLVEGDRPAGWHEASLDAAGLAPGLYHVQLCAGTFVGAARFTVVR